MTLLILPENQPIERNENSQRVSMLQVLKIPGIQVCSLGIAATSASIGFISVILLKLLLK
jgi:hypothetical protein